MPKETREELDRRLVDGAFSGYRELSKWLATKGCKLGFGAVASYGRKLERRLEALKLATEQARAVVEAAPDDDNQMNQALMRLVQQHLFTVLVELKAENLKELNLSSLARSVADMGRAAAVQKRLSDEMQAKVKEKVAAAEQKVLAAARASDDGGGAAMGGGGLSSQAEERIRKALLEITQ